MSSPLEDDPSLAPMAKEAEEHIRKTGRLAILGLLAETFTQKDIVILGLLGIDVKQKLLDVIIEECKNLKGEPL